MADNVTETTLNFVKNLETEGNVSAIFVARTIVRFISMQHEFWRGKLIDSTKTTKPVSSKRSNLFNIIALFLSVENLRTYYAEREEKLFPVINTSYQFRFGDIKLYKLFLAQLTAVWR